jgi:hypothetical protein
MSSGVYGFQPMLTTINFYQPLLTLWFPVECPVDSHVYRFVKVLNSERIVETPERLERP